MAEHGRVDLTGREVTEVRAYGKHLLTRLDEGTTLHTHLRMEGQWRVARTGSAASAARAPTCEPCSRTRSGRASESASGCSTWSARATSTCCSATWDPTSSRKTSSAHRRAASCARRRACATRHRRVVSRPRSPWAGPRQPCRGPPWPTPCSTSAESPDSAPSTRPRDCLPSGCGRGPRSTTSPTATWRACCGRPED
ncbi:DNA-formamidopyrimidine glycosylase family protein [Oerskovia sp. M15]